MPLKEQMKGLAGGKTSTTFLFGRAPFRHHPLRDVIEVAGFEVLQTAKSRRSLVLAEVQQPVAS